jgi:uncharacterized protein
MPADDQPMSFCTFIKLHLTYRTHDHGLSALRQALAVICHLISTALKYLFTLSFLLALAFQSCHSQDTIKKIPPKRLNISKARSDSLAMHLPSAKGLINDFVQLFTDDELKTLDSLVSTFESATTVEISIATINSKMVKNEDFEDYTLVMASMWGIGKKGKNNGLLIAICPDLRRMRIQNGYGIENVLSDAETKNIIDNYFIPKFKEGKYFEGTKDGIIAIINKLKQNGL